MRYRDRQYAVASLVSATLMLTSCINTEFGCKGYPEGARCQATSQILAQDPAETGGYLSSEESGRRDSSGQTARTKVEPASGATNGRASNDVAVVGPAPLELGKPIVRPPHIIRAWLAPWRDHQDRLHEASYVYIMIDPAEWAYTGPALGLSRHERARHAVLPKAPSLPLGRERGSGSGHGQGPAVPAGRPSPQAAGVAPPPAPAAHAPAASTAQTTAGAPPMLMVPGAQGMRPVPIPQVPQIELDVWGD